MKNILSPFKYGDFSSVGGLDLRVVSCILGTSMVFSKGLQFFVIWMKLPWRSISYSNMASFIFPIHWLHQSKTLLEYTIRSNDEKLHDLLTTGGQDSQPNIQQVKCLLEKRRQMQNRMKNVTEICVVVKVGNALINEVLLYF